MILANVRYSANTKGLGSWALECLVSSSKPCSNLRRNSSTSSETRHAARLRATPPNSMSAMRNSPNVSRGQSEPWNRYELPPSERAGTVTKWAERSDAMSAIVVSYICATLRAVWKPCQFSIPADYLLSARHALAPYHHSIFEAFIWYRTYITMVTRMAKRTTRSNTKLHQASTGDRIFGRDEV